jgi:hypothetical protein
MLSRYAGKGERKYSSYSLFSSVLDGVSVTPRPRFTPRERTPGTHWVDLRAGLDTEVRGKVIFFCRGSNPDRPV